MDLMVVVGLTIVVGFLTIVLLAGFPGKQSSSCGKRKRRLPPGPSAWPVIGNLSIFATERPHARLGELAKEHGPVMSLRLGSNLAVVISSADMAREVLKVQDRSFASRAPLQAYRHLAFQEGTCGFQAYGSRHQYVRKIMVTELFTPKRLERFQQFREEELAAAMRFVLQKSPGEVNVFDLGTSIAINNLSRMLMSTRFCAFEHGEPIGQKSDLVDPQEVAEYMSVISDINRLLGMPMVGDHIPFLGFLDTFRVRAMRKLRSRLSSFLSNIIDTHRQRMIQTENWIPQSFVDVLLTLPGEEGVDKDQAMKGMLTDILLAGVEPSVVVAEWAFAYLLRNPQMMRKAMQEMDSVVGRDRQLQESDVVRLTYLQAVWKEAVRLHPPAPFLIPHYATEDCKLGDYDIPANTTVFVSSWSIHRSPDAWDNPLEFRPERFIERDIDIRGQNFDMLPFGSGRRSCPAAAMGMTVSSFFLAKLLHSFDWSLPQGQKPEDVDMSDQFGLAVPMKRHLRGLVFLLSSLFVPTILFSRPLANAAYCICHHDGLDRSGRVWDHLVLSDKRQLFHFAVSAKSIPFSQQSGSEVPWW